MERARQSGRRNTGHRCAPGPAHVPQVSPRKTGLAAHRPSWPGPRQTSARRPARRRCVPIPRRRRRENRRNLFRAPTDRPVTVSPYGTFPAYRALPPPLDDGDELDEGEAGVVAQEPVHIPAVYAVPRVVHGGQGVVLDAVPAQELESTHHPVEGRLARPVHPVGVMHLAWAVEESPTRKPCSSKNWHHSSSIEAVGLDRVMTTVWLGRTCGLDPLHRATEEVQLHHGRLAALPGDRHLRAVRCASSSWRM